MVRERFDNAFEQVRKQSNRLADTERSTDNFDEIVEQRVELDRRRDEVTKARKEIVSRFEPAAPDVVEPPRGRTTTKLLGKVGAAIVVALFVGATASIYLAVRTLAGDSPISVDEINETVDACQWHLDATVRNTSTDPVTIERVEVILNKQRTRIAPVDEWPTLAPGATEQLAMSRSLRIVGCPPVDEIDHGDLIIDVVDAGSRSTRF